MHSKGRCLLLLQSRNDRNNVCIFRIVAQKIQENSPGTLVLTNEVPKAWVDFEIYCQLIPNNDPNLMTYKVLPRIGAFEVSFKGVVSYSIK